MTQTQTLARMKKPFGTAKMVDLTAVRYLACEDAFEVDFEDGLTFLEPHATIRKANKISAKAEAAKPAPEKPAAKVDADVSWHDRKHSEIYITLSGISVFGKRETQQC